MFLLYVYRFVLVVVLLGVASVLLKRQGELPLALKGLQRMLRKTSGAVPAAGPVPVWKRVLAFLLILAAFAVAVM